MPLHEMKDLIGFTVTDIEVSKDRTQLVLKEENWQAKKYRYAILEVDGDCCSQSWIEGADNTPNLLGTIQHIEEIPMPERGDGATLNHPSVDCVSFYGLKIVTDKGTCVIDYRNDSNGYYGGNIYLKSIEEGHYNAIA